MSVVGFDFGNENCVVAIAKDGAIRVVFEDDESKPEIPAVVCFGDKQRFLGTAGAALSLKSPENTIYQIKRLIGRHFSDPELQQDLKMLPFTVSRGLDGYPLIHTRYLGEVRTFTPTQVLGMVFSNLKRIAERNLNAPVVDCCIAVPVYFTDLQRKVVIDAATIAGLHPLQLIHETTATALAYGIYKTDLPENDQLNVAFVDIGHASMQVCIAGFKKGQLKILAHSFDQSLGGRDFDEVLFKHFAAKFMEKYKIVVFQNSRACLQLRAACERLKKVLSGSPEAPLYLECLEEWKDLRGFIKRKEFEQISSPILQRVRKPLEKALSEAGLTVGKIHAVEVVGSCSHMPVIIRILTDFFGKEPKRAMNASECVARGCALEGAILSSTFKPREFQVNECFPFTVAVSWEAATPHAQKGGADNRQSTIIFPKGNPIPSVKALSFYRSGAFTIDVQYADATKLHARAMINRYTIGPFQTKNGEPIKVKVKVRLNLHGIVSVESATIFEEEEFEIPVVKDQAKEATEMETDAKVEPPKKRVKKTKVPVSEIVYGFMPFGYLQNAVEEEFEMALLDRVMKETKDKKNAVEAYLHDMRNKLQEKYREFVTDSERQSFSAKLQEVEDWLHKDGEDKTKSVYVSKLEELKKQGDPIELRYKGFTEIGSVIDQLVDCFSSYREAALSNNPMFDHIDLADKQKVLSECEEAEAWLRETKKHGIPVLLLNDCRRKAEALNRFCGPIMNKPKPATPRIISQTPQGSEPHSQCADQNTTNANSCPSGNAGAASQAHRTHENCPDRITEMHDQQRQDTDDRRDARIHIIVEKLGDIADAITELSRDRLNVQALYHEIMKLEGFDEAFLGSAFDYLVEHEKLGKAFMVKSEKLRRIWLQNFEKK